MLTNNIYIYFFVILILNSIDSKGQKYFGFSFDYNLRTSLSSSIELNSSTTELNNRHFKALSPSFSIQIKRIKDNFKYCIELEKGTLLVYNGIGIGETNLHHSTGAETYNGLFYKDVSIKFGYKILQLQKLTYFFIGSIHYLFFRNNNSTSSFGFADVRYKKDGSGDIAEKNITFIDNYVFYRNNTILVGVSSNLNYKINKKIYLNFILSYNQGLYMVYSAVSSIKANNYLVGYSSFFEQVTYGKLSNFSLGIGVTYRLRRKKSS